MFKYPVFPQKDLIALVVVVLHAVPGRLRLDTVDDRREFAGRG